MFLIVIIIIIIIRRNSLMDLSTSQVGGMVELEKQEEHELQLQQKQLFVDISEQYCQEHGLASRLKLSDNSSETKSACSSSFSNDTRPSLLTGKNARVELAKKSRIRASSAPFVPRIMVQGVKISFTNAVQSGGENDGQVHITESNNTHQQAIMVLPRHALSLRAVSTQAMKKRARQVFRI